MKTIHPHVQGAQQISGTRNSLKNKTKQKLLNASNKKETLKSSQGRRSRDSSVPIEEKDKMTANFISKTM